MFAGQIKHEAMVKRHRRANASQIVHAAHPVHVVPAAHAVVRESVLYRRDQRLGHSIIHSFIDLRIASLARVIALMLVRKKLVTINDMRQA